VSWDAFRPRRACEDAVGAAPAPAPAPAAARGFLRDAVLDLDPAPDRRPKPPPPPPPPGAAEILQGLVDESLAAGIDKVKTTSIDDLGLPPGLDLFGSPPGDTDSDG